jgi:hypothetical protein
MNSSKPRARLVEPGAEVSVSVSVTNQAPANTPIPVPPYRIAGEEAEHRGQELQRHSKDQNDHAHLVRL